MDRNRIKANLKMLNNQNFAFYPLSEGAIMLNFCQEKLIQLELLYQYYMYKYWQKSWKIFCMNTSHNRA